MKSLFIIIIIFSLLSCCINSSAYAQQKGSIAKEHIRGIDSILKEKTIYNYWSVNVWPWSNTFSLGSAIHIANKNNQFGITAAFLSQGFESVIYEGANIYPIHITSNCFSLGISNKLFLFHTGRGVFIDFAGGLNFPIFASYYKKPSRSNSKPMSAKLLRMAPEIGGGLGVRLATRDDFAVTIEGRYRYQQLTVITDGDYFIHQTGIAIGLSF